MRILLVSVVLAILVISVALVVIVFPQPPAFSSNSNETTSNQVSSFLSKHPLLFFDEPFFIDGITSKKQAQLEVNIVGGIIPHHLFPGFMIAEFFNQIKDQDVDKIILLGPNHHELGDYPFLTSQYAWETPSGLVEPEIQSTRFLLNHNSSSVGVDELVLEHEHSIGGIMPFIEHYLPEVKVVPLAISGYANPEEVDTLVKDLYSIIDDKTVIIASVDFSHYLNNREAQAKDLETLAVMETRDYQTLYHFNSDYLDSPQSIIVLLKLVDKLKKNTPKILHHSNSGILLQQDHIETTSYFSMVFY